ncbi:phenylalanine--tRNA ligase subunit alpha [Succinivibrio dextrinosolvens]|uniref:phenylalanine--tRNA ligase subunit alpha n=1 Tax=Succinivibrio dextrinosolvens TaxID=83771 RepID=UPI0019229CB7|nr:phenylalanine--tRNA ligase subunit alpha [Succinivibrio dextrinosolvens]
MDNLEQAKLNGINAANNAKDLQELEAVKTNFLGKKGEFTAFMRELGKLSAEERPQRGAIINEARQAVIDAIETKKAQIEKALLETKLSNETVDITLPGRKVELGNEHPISRTIQRIKEIFGSMGFSVVGGPEIEDDYHNFDALNLPPNHPARSSQDTFSVENGLLLRSQTSSVQVRTMETQKPPIRIIAPGRVYRNDYDMTHTPMFHQVEGLLVEEHTSFAELKGVLHEFLLKFFEEELEVRFRPSFFPFTEPSAEVDLRRKGGKWLEVLGCGMVHPNVLKNVGIDTDKYVGYAFGMGVERLTMLRYGVNDLRAFFENDLRFLKQFA